LINLRNGFISFDLEQGYVNVAQAFLARASHPTLQYLLDSHKSVFYNEDAPTISSLPRAQTMKAHLRPLPKEEQDFIDDQIGLLLRKGWIKKEALPWSCPFIVTRPSNDRKPPMLVDFRS
jgi:hypothetical protein